MGKIYFSLRLPTSPTILQSHTSVNTSGRCCNNDAKKYNGICYHVLMVGCVLNKTDNLITSSHLFTSGICVKFFLDKDATLNKNI